MLDFEKIAQDAYHDEMDKIAGGKASKALDALRKSFKTLKPNLKEASRLRRKAKEFTQTLKDDAIPADFSALNRLNKKGTRRDYRALVRKSGLALGTLGVGAAGLAGGGYALARD